MFSTEEIKRRIPHRPPFLFIDEVVEIEEGRLVAERSIREDELHFEGHYPGNPIMPGVLICEAAFQAAAVLLVNRLEAQGEEIGGRTPVLSRISDARFKAMVKPGDQIKIIVTHKETISRFEFLDAVIEKDGRKAATLSFALALIAE
ncbi:3-hydroxyacyl-ACP dehydratase FabZ family protein [Puniceicoccus vermicola]|uniref:Beta-hydroxyacyl-ACP dehydratase n=1 Tax=Puniceicoccus vermicola TaxID=388746 RepID=A0A7X1B1Z7_9BACT|nr:3-hydroxyacyl-ACP dehydratase FabZ family protein [Puniceicoccus vermicola]MBC2604052.1 beta-hydroxyacyl-ACP dehydratase [Puniceicoccus vermicola]